MGLFVRCARHCGKLHKNEGVAEWTKAAALLLDADATATRWAVAEAWRGLQHRPTEELPDLERLYQNFW